MLRRARACLMKGSDPTKYPRRNPGNKDLEKYGPTIGCRGCEAQNRGIKGINHNEGCRTRIEAAIQIDDPGRYGRVLSKLVQESVEKEVMAQSWIRSLSGRTRTRRQAQYSKQAQESSAVAAMVSRTHRCGRYRNTTVVVVRPSEYRRSSRPCIHIPWQHNHYRWNSSTNRMVCC